MKWNSKPLDAKWHFHHLNSLERLAQSGVKWVHGAQTDDSPILSPRRRWFHTRIHRLSTGYALEVSGQVQPLTRYIDPALLIGGAGNTITLEHGAVGAGEP